MERPKIEAELTEEQKKEVVKYELKQIWDNLILELDRNEAPENERLMNGKINGNEFERIMQKYEEQGRPLASFENLLTALHKIEENEEKIFKQIALFYRDIEYDQRGSVEENRKKSFNFAVPYMKLLKLTSSELKFFRDIIMGKK
ncbi:MAG: hypothetical protein WC323_04490 [Patescibacteria group bacterium]|jgi:hypothetical protein